MFSFALFSYFTNLSELLAQVYSCFLFAFSSDADEVDTFSIDPNTGRIKLAKSLDSMHRNHYRLMVKAEDDSEPPKSDSAEVSSESINVLINCVVTFKRV